MSVTPTLVEKNGKVTISITNLTLDGKTVNTTDDNGYYEAADDSEFYINWPNRGGRYYIPASQIRQGTVTIPNFGDGFSPGANKIELYRDCGPFCNHGSPLCLREVTMSQGSANPNYRCTWDKGQTAYNLCIHAATDADLQNSSTSIYCTAAGNCTGVMNETFNPSITGEDENGQRYTCINMDVAQVANFVRAATTLKADVKINGQTVCSVGINPEDRAETAEQIDEEKAKLAGFDYCKQAPAGPQRSECEKCVGTVDPSPNGEPAEQSRIWTAVGCVRVSGAGLTEDIVGLLLGVSGGIALLTILGGAFIFATSQGDTSKVKQGKEMITAAVMGIIFIIFSVIILDFIGVKLLRIPGLG